MFLELGLNSTLIRVTKNQFSPFDFQIISSFVLIILCLYSDKPSQVELQGEALNRENEISNLPRDEKDLDNLITFHNLVNYGFYNQGVAQVPYLEFKKKMSKKLLNKKIKCLTGRGKGLALTLFYLMQHFIFIS